MDCKECYGKLFPLNGLYTDRDGIRRDYYCPFCHIRCGFIKTACDNEFKRDI